MTNRTRASPLFGRFCEQSCRTGQTRRLSTSPPRAPTTPCGVSMSMRDEMLWHGFLDGPVPLQACCARPLFCANFTTEGWAPSWRHRRFVTSANLMSGFRITGPCSTGSTAPMPGPLAATLTDARSTLSLRTSPRHSPRSDASALRVDVSAAPEIEAGPLVLCWNVSTVGWRQTASAGAVMPLRLDHRSAHPGRVGACSQDVSVGSLSDRS